MLQFKVVCRTWTEALCTFELDISENRSRFKLFITLNAPDSAPATEEAPFETSKQLGRPQNHPLGYTTRSQHSSSRTQGTFLTAGIILSVVFFGNETDIDFRHFSSCPSTKIYLDVNTPHTHTPPSHTHTNTHTTSTHTHTLHAHTQQPTHSSTQVLCVSTFPRVLSWVGCVWIILLQIIYGVRKL